MANTHLKEAVRRAGLTVEEFAEIIRVDPKSVKRWLAGTSTPYPRHRASIARALDLPEEQLWPELLPLTQDGHSQTPVTDRAGAWTDASAPGAPNPVALIARARQQLDVLDADGSLLAQPVILNAIRETALAGCRARVLTTAVSEEAARLGRQPGVELRGLARRLPNSLVRADDAILLGIPLTVAPAFIAFERHETNGMFDRLSEHFTILWDQEASPADPRGGGAGTGERDRTGSSPGADGPGAPSTPAVISGDAEPTRRWPRRPA